MKTRDLVRMGIPAGACADAAKADLAAARDAERRGGVRRWRICGGWSRRPRRSPSDRDLRRARRRDADCAQRAGGSVRPPQGRRAVPHLGRATSRPTALQQMKNACQLPVAVSGALMPDAHVGYGLPIGGVLATRDAVIPYAVGVDIACRMKMTVLDLPLGGAGATMSDRLTAARSSARRASASARRSRRGASTT